MLKKLLDVTEAAEYLGVAEKTLYKWVSLKKIPYVKLSPKCLKFDIQDLDRWITEKRIQPVDATDFMPNDVRKEIFSKN